MRHRVYYAMFYISTVDRRPADIPRASYNRASNLYCNLYYCSLQEIAVTVVKKNIMRAYTQTFRMHVHESPSILLCSKLSRFSNSALRVETTRKSLSLQAFGVDIWTERKNRYSKSITIAAVEQNGDTSKIF